MPIHIFLPPVILLYELSIIYLDEKVGNPSKTATFLSWVRYIFIGLPSGLLEFTGSFGLHTKSVINHIQQALWTTFFIFVWKPLFQVLPFIFNMINSRVYNTLPALGRNDIRLLEIHPSAPSNNLVLRIKNVSLDGNEACYEALSYSGGPGLILRRTVQASGRTLLITDSAFCALKELQAPDRTRTLWTDAICINQTDSAEKNKQVELMHAIYTRATKVIVWLGAAPKQLDEALLQCRATATYPSIRYMPTKLYSNPSSDGDGGPASGSLKKFPWLGMLYSESAMLRFLGLFYQVSCRN